MNTPKCTQDDSLLSFATGDADEFVERMSGIAPGLHCSPYRAHQVNIKICAAKLPKLGLFASTLASFRVESPVRPYYGITIPLEGHSSFRVDRGYEDINRAKGHLQHPDRPFDAKMPEAPFKSLQLCFDQAALDSFAIRMQGGEARNTSLTESLDLVRPDVRSFARHAAFIWSEIMRGGPVVALPLIAQESVDLLSTLLLAAADQGTHSFDEHDRRSRPASMRRAEDYLMDNLSNAISIADVAMAAGMSARTLSREFRRHHETTIKGFIRERRLEAANQTLLVADPRETNVTQVALNLGLDQLGRFSADYKRAFGELPSETLAR